MMSASDLLKKSVTTKGNISSVGKKYEDLSKGNEGKNWLVLNAPKLFD